MKQCPGHWKQRSSTQEMEAFVVDRAMHSDVPSNRNLRWGP